MVELLDLRCDSLEVLGFHVEDEYGDIEAVDLLELLFKHGWSEVTRELGQFAQPIGERGFYEYRLETLLLPCLSPYPGRCAGIPQ